MAFNTDYGFHYTLYNKSVLEHNTQKNTLGLLQPKLHYHHPLTLQHFGLKSVCLKDNSSYIHLTIYYHYIIIVTIIITRQVPDIPIWLDITGFKTEISGGQISPKAHGGQIHLTNVTVL